MNIEQRTKAKEKIQNIFDTYEKEKTNIYKNYDYKYDYKDLYSNPHIENKSDEEEYDNTFDVIIYTIIGSIVALLVFLWFQGETTRDSIIFPFIGIGLFISMLIILICSSIGHLGQSDAEEFCMILLFMVFFGGFCTLLTFLISLPFPVSI